MNVIAPPDPQSESKRDSGFGHYKILAEYAALDCIRQAKLNLACRARPLIESLGALPRDCALWFEKTKKDAKTLLQIIIGFCLSDAEPLSRQFFQYCPPIETERSLAVFDWYRHEQVRSVPPKSIARVRP